MKMLEFERLSKPETQAGITYGTEVKGKRSQGGIAVITSGLPQDDSTVMWITDYPRKSSAKVTVNVVTSYSRGRLYGVNVNDTIGSVKQWPNTPMAEEHKRYLQRVSGGTSPSISANTAKKAWRIWIALQKATNGLLPIPSAATGPNGVMFYSWDNGIHHLEAEVYSDRPTEFFYRNRDTGEFWGEDSPTDSLSSALSKRLHFFLH